MAGENFHEVMPNPSLSCVPEANSKDRREFPVIKDARFA